MFSLRFFLLRGIDVESKTISTANEVNSLRDLKWNMLSNGVTSVCGDLRMARPVKQVLDGDKNVIIVVISGVQFHKLLLSLR